MNRSARGSNNTAQRVTQSRPDDDGLPRAIASPARSPTLWCRLMRAHPPIPPARPGRLPAALCAAALALAALTSGCSSSTGVGHNAGGATTATPSASAPSATGFYGALLPAGLRPREFSLTNQDGRRVSLSVFRGHVTILTFLYTASRTTAPLIAQQIRGALDELESEQGQPVPALAVSVDPAADTPSRMRAFLRENSLTGRLEYLTGLPSQLRAVWRAYTVVPAGAGASAYERAAFVLLLDQEGAPRVEFPVEELNPEALAHDIRRLQSE
jgi:cytochrome oxidase Cu insertion factor (SCO1/SenC/PrrC family)